MSRYWSQVRQYWSQGRLKLWYTKNICLPLNRLRLRVHMNAIAPSNVICPSWISQSRILNIRWRPWGRIYTPSQGIKSRSMDSGWCNRSSCGTGVTAHGLDWQSWMLLSFPWAYICYVMRRHTARSRQISNSRDVGLRLCDRPEIWQAPQQQCCRCAYPNSELDYDSKHSLTASRPCEIWR